METTDIKNLLDRFYRGETSLDEEKRLTDFFRQTNVPNEFLADKKVFDALSENTVDVPLESVQAIDSLIDSFTDDKTEEPKIKKLHIRYWAIGVAASLAIIFGVSQFQKSQQPRETLFTDTYKNPDDAYQATMDALQLFSENFSKGTQTVEKANSRLEETQKIINQSIK